MPGFVAAFIFNHFIKTVVIESYWKRKLFDSDKIEGGRMHLLQKSTLAFVMYCAFYCIYAITPNQTITSLLCLCR